MILAAGAGTRMKSQTPKVLHRILGQPMLRYPLDAALGLRPERVVIVAGNNHEVIRDALSTPDVTYAVQDRPLGTADALIRALPVLKNLDTVVVLNGDAPLLTAKTLQSFLKYHYKSTNSVSFISFIAEDAAQYGRVIRDSDGNLQRIVELSDLNDKEQSVKEVNSGVYAIDARALSLLKNIERNKKKGEYYLTDIVGIALKRGLRTNAWQADESEFLGVNTRAEFSAATKALKERIVWHWLNEGVDFIDADSVFIEPTVMIAPETVIYPNVYLGGKTVIGKNCIIYPNVRVADSIIKNGSVIKDSTVMEGAVVGPLAEVGPFARLRPGSIIGSAKVGNFVELKNSSLGNGAKAMHLSYIGDATVGRDVNIGAGTITCNYDGQSKHPTVIEDGVFIGSDTQLIAPVKVGKGSYIGAGSTITRNVPADALAISRTAQKNIEGWALKRKRLKDAGKKR